MKETKWSRGSISWERKQIIYFTFIKLVNNKKISLTLEWTKNESRYRIFDIYVFKQHFFSNTDFSWNAIKKSLLEWKYLRASSDSPKMSINSLICKSLFWNNFHDTILLLVFSLFIVKWSNSENPYSFYILSDTNIAFMLVSSSQNLSPVKLFFLKLKYSGFTTWN